jgi:hypothetical protein
MANVTLMQEAEMLNTRPTTTSTSYVPTGLSMGGMKVYTSKFDPLTGVYFMCTFSPTFTGAPNGTGSTSVQLYNYTQSAAVPGSEMTGTSAGTTYYRKVSSNLLPSIADGDVVYPQYKSGSNTTSQIRSAKLIFLQRGKILKTCTFIHIGDSFLTSSGLSPEVTNRKRWAHTSTDYDGTVAYSFQVVGSSYGGATARFRLRDITAAADRAELTTVSTTDVFLEGTPSALTDGNELSVRVATDTPITDGAQLRNAFFIIEQSVGPSKLRSAIQVWGANSVTSGATVYPATVFEEAEYFPLHWANMTVAAVHEGSIKNSGTGTTYLQLLDDGGALANTEITTVQTAFTRVVSAAVTPPTDYSDLDFDMKASAGTATMCSSRLVLTLTGLDTTGGSDGDMTDG